MALVYFSLLSSLNKEKKTLSTNTNIILFSNNLLSVDYFVVLERDQVVPENVDLAKILKTQNIIHVDVIK